MFDEYSEWGEFPSSLLLGTFTSSFVAYYPNLVICFQCSIQMHYLQLVNISSDSLIRLQQPIKHNTLLIPLDARYIFSLMNLVYRTFRIVKVDVFFIANDFLMQITPFLLLLKQHFTGNQKCFNKSLFQFVWNLIFFFSDHTNSIYTFPINI